MEVEALNDPTAPWAENGWPGDDEPTHTIAERAEDIDQEPEAEAEELFVLEAGRKVTISTLIARSTPVEFRMNLNAKSVRGGGEMGLLAYSDPHITLVVPARQGKVSLEPTYDDSGAVQKVVVYVNFKPLTIYDAASEEGRAALGL